MGPTKTFNVALANKSHTKAAITEEGSTIPSYEAELGWFARELFTTSTKHSITLRAAHGASDIISEPDSKSDSTILGVVDFPFNSLSNPIKICFSNPSSTKATEWETIVSRRTLLNNTFELSLTQPGSPDHSIFDWKRTHNIAGKGVTARELDYLHLKMIDRRTGKVVARFVHHLWFGKKRGVFEIEELKDGDEGVAWERFVLLSGMAVLEYLRKIYGYSF